MKRTLEIRNKPEQVKSILTSIRKDGHLARTFEGITENGLLNGFYTNLTLINGSAIGYAKIKGQYNCDRGDLKLEVAPSNLYWIILTLALLVIAFLTYKGITENKMFYIGSLLFLFMALGWTIAFVWESNRFMKHVHRFIN